MGSRKNTLRIQIRGEPFHTVSLKLFEQQAAIALRQVRLHLKQLDTPREKSCNPRSQKYILRGIHLGGVVTQAEGPLPGGNGMGGGLVSGPASQRLMGSGLGEKDCGVRTL